MKVGETLPSAPGRTLVSKGEFARRKNRAASCVTKWIQTGKISKAAMIGEGQRARIWVERAEQDLAELLHPGQQLGLDDPIEQGSAPASSPIATGAVPAEAPTPRLSAAEEQTARYRKAKADQAEIDAERARRKELADRGEYMATTAARTAWAKELADLIGAIDEWLPELAALIAAEKPTDPKTATIVVRDAWHEFRRKRHDLAKSAAEDAPELVGE